MNQCNLVVLPGLEPGISGPESDVLPLHHRTESMCLFLTAQRYILLLLYQNDSKKTYIYFLINRKTNQSVQRQ